MKTPAELAADAIALEGIPIWGVLPGSAAARAGVRYGDIVVRVNGRQTRTLDQFLSARDALVDRVEFDVVRDGEVLRLDIELASAAFA